MLPGRNRLRRSADFSAVLRHGHRAGRGTVVLHLAPPAGVSLSDLAPEVSGNEVSGNEVSGNEVSRSELAGDGAVPAGLRPRVTRIGLIVGRGVGNSVVRHQVSRRLRGVLAGRVNRFPVGSDVVVRARPAAAKARSGELADDLDGALATVLRRVSRPVPVSTVPVSPVPVPTARSSR